MRTIIARAPTRLSLGGGPTDLPSYSNKFGGFVVNAAINKYAYCAVHETYDHPIRLAYSQTEVVDSIDEIQHNIFREVLKMMEIKDHIECVTWTDSPDGTGLGGSSAFTVALILALYTYLGKTISKKELAEMACDIEINKCGYAVGKQDQHAAAFGGIHTYNFCKDGDVLVDSLNGMNFKKFRNELVMFYTGVAREGWKIQRENIDKIDSCNAETVKNLHEVKELGKEIRRCLAANSFEEFAIMMDKHWQRRKEMGTSNETIDNMYKKAKELGVTGGKLLGAGGGGFFLLHCSDSKIKEELKKHLPMNGAVKANFDWDFEGAKVILQ